MRHRKRWPAKSNFKLFLFVGLFAASFPARLLPAINFGSIHIQLVNPPSPPSEIAVSLTAEFLSRPLVRYPDSSGNAVFMGLPPGFYSLRLQGLNQKEWKHDIVLEPGQFLHLEVKLVDFSEKPAVESFDLEDIGAQTVISRHQLAALPSADNLWSVLENQDLSATTNRIDPAGLWADHPVLFSARGATSWTQNEIKLNGFDVTEPYFGGTPMFLPDLAALEAIRHRNAMHPASATASGGQLYLEPRRGGNVFRAGSSYALIQPSFSANNLTPALEKEGITESHTFGHDRKLRLWVSGPFSSGQRFFLSLQTQQLSRNLAAYPGENRSRWVSGIARVDHEADAGVFTLFWTGQQVVEEEAGAGRNIAPEATLKAKQTSHVAQFFWQTSPGSRAALKSGISLSYQKTSTRPYAHSASYSSREIFRPLVWAAPARYGDQEKWHLNFVFAGNMLFRLPSSSHHRLDFGLEASWRSNAEESRVPGGTHLLFLEGEPTEVAFFTPPAKEREQGLNVSFYFEDTWNFAGRLILTAGGRVSLSRGWSPAQAEVRSFGGFTNSSSSRVEWLNFLPQASLALPFQQGKKGFLKIYYGQTALSLPLNYLRWGNSNAEGCLIYSWNDLNGNHRLESQEVGRLLRREGPFFSRVDANLKRPVTTEFSASLVLRLKQDYFFSLSGFTRLTKNLIETENIGVPGSAYEKLILEDSGDDRIWGTHDDLSLPLFNRLASSLGKDFFFLTNPDAANRTSRYRGLDLVFLRRFCTREVLYFSFTATEAFGTTSPGNTEWENDDALIGWLYDDPNSLLNARGRLRFDRAYTVRLGMTLNLPAGFRAGLILKYYDGQPFTRKILVSNLNQGPIYLQAFPRGIARYEFNMTADARLEKTIPVGGGKFQFFLEGYNLFNQHLATEENEWTSDLFPLRYATEIQTPRVLRLGLKVEF